MTSGDREHPDSAANGRHAPTGGAVRCIVLLPRGTEAPDELMSSLKARNLDITTVSSPAAVMAELGEAEIEYRQLWSAQYERASAAEVAEGVEPPLPERRPMILLTVEPIQIDSVLDLNAAVARFYPSVLRWCYDPNGNPRLGPMSPTEPVALADDQQDEPVPQIHTRPVGPIKPQPRTPAPTHSLRLRHDDEGVDDEAQDLPSAVQDASTDNTNEHTNGNGRKDYSAAPSDPSPPARPGNHPDEAVTSEELAMLLSPDDPENTQP